MEMSGQLRVTAALLRGKEPSVPIAQEAGWASARLNIFQFMSYYEQAGAHISVVVKALCYKPEGRGFDSR
jgi:hypothetical protein